MQIIDFESGDLLHVIESPIKFSVNEALDLPPYFHRIAFSDDDDHLFVQFTQYDGHLFWEPHASYVVHIESGTWTKCTVAFIEPTDCATATIIDGTVVALRKTRDVDSMAFSLSSDRSKLLLIERHRSGEDELVLRVWDTHELSPLSEPWVTSDHTYPIGEGDPPVATWLGNRPIVLYAMPEPSAGLTVLDVHGRAVLLSLALPFYPDDVVLSPDGQWLALSGIDSSNVWVYALDKVDGGSEAGAPMPRLVPQVGHGGSISGLTVSDDGRIVATAGEGGWVSLWERASAESSAACRHRVVK